MINGLDHANYNQLTGLYDLRASSISTDEISYEEIYTLNNINTNQTIQTQINNIQTTLSNMGSLTISGNTLSGVVLLPYLEQYYYKKQNIDDTNTNAYNTMIDIFDNYYPNSFVDSTITTLSGRINTISGRLESAKANITLLDEGLVCIGQLIIISILLIIILHLYQVKYIHCLWK